MAQVAFIGLGVMGYPMAGHLKNRGGHEVTVYNRTAAKAEKWAAEYGGATAPTPAEAASGKDFVFSCVGNDDDLRSVTLGPDGAFQTMKAGSIFIDNTTASAEIARELAAEAEKRGFGFIDAPVSGGQAGAENGVLSVMCGGDPATFERAKPVIEAFGRTIGLMGPAGAGQLTKMVNQICIAGLVQGLAEGIHFAKKAGLNIEKVRLDAQGPGHLPRRGQPQRRQTAGDGLGRPVLQRSPGYGWTALGHVLAARASRKIGERRKALANLRFAPVTKQSWPDFETLFEDSGGPKYCWCMAWRDMPNRQSATNAERKQAMKSFVETGTPVGILAYLDGKPVAWCSIAPRESLRRLAPWQDDAERNVWAIVCFFIKRTHRRQGIASALLDAALEYAFAEGATAVEASPVEPDSPSYRFMGCREMYLRRGFRELGMAGSRRHVMRLDRA